MSWGNSVYSNPSINQLTEKKHSKRTASYRPLERTEPLKRIAGWKTEAQSVKRSTQKYRWVEEGLRECHMKNQSEEIGALWSAKKHHQEELGRRGQRKSQEKQHSGEKGALEKEQHNQEKELGKKLKKPKKKP